MLIKINMDAIVKTEDEPTDVSISRSRNPSDVNTPQASTSSYRESSAVGSRRRQRPRGYSPEVVTPTQRKSTTAKHDSVNNTPSTSKANTPSTSKAPSERMSASVEPDNPQTGGRRSIKAAKRFSPPASKAHANSIGTMMELVSSREASKDYDKITIRLSDLGAILRKRCNTIQIYKTDPRQFNGLKPTVDKVETTEIVKKEDDSDVGAVKVVSRKSITKSTVKIKLPRKSIPKKIEPEDSGEQLALVKEELQPDKVETEAPTPPEEAPEQTEPESASEDADTSEASRPKRLAAGKGRTFIAELTKKRTVRTSLNTSTLSEPASSEESLLKEEKPATPTTTVAMVSTVETVEIQTQSDEIPAKRAKKNTPNTTPTSAKKFTKKNSLPAVQSPLVTQVDSAPRPKRAAHPSTKLLDSMSSTPPATKTPKPEPSFKIEAKRNSALGIIRNTKIFQMERSPSPVIQSRPSSRENVVTAGPAPTDVAPEISVPEVPIAPKIVEHPKPLLVETKPAIVEPKFVKETKPLKETKPAREPKVKEKPRVVFTQKNPAFKKPLVQEVPIPTPEPPSLQEEPIEEAWEATEVMQVVEPEVPVKTEVPAEVSTTLESITIEQAMEETKPCIDKPTQPENVPESPIEPKEPEVVKKDFEPKPGRSKGPLLQEANPFEEKKKQPVVTPEPTRVSRRTIKPVKFDDFVQTDIVHISSEAKPVNRARKSIDLPTPSSSKEVVFTNKKSSKKNPPIRLKLKFGGRSLTVENKGDAAGEEKETGQPEVVEPQPVLPVVHKVVPKKKRPANRPFIEDLQLPDGTVEPLNEILNDVIDKALDQVAKKVSKESSSKYRIALKTKKKNQSLVAKQRYAIKKANYEIMKADLLAKGEQPPVFSHTLTSYGKKKPVVSSPPPVEIETKRHDRARKSTIYNENEYLLEPQRVVTKKVETPVPEVKERGAKKALDYLSKSFQKEIDSMDEPVTFIRKRKHVSTVEKMPDAPVVVVPVQPPVPEAPKTLPFGVFLENRDPNLVGLMGTCGYENTPDYFYRDILNDNRYMGSDDTGDIDMDDNDSFQAYSESPPSKAQTLADRIGQLLTRPIEPGETYGVSKLYERIGEETYLRKSLLNQVMDIITGHYVAESSSSGRCNGVILYNITIKNAGALRNAFYMINEERSDCVYWVHKTLVELLPLHFLASYLTLLQFCKPMAYTYVGRIIKSCANGDEPWPQVSSMILEFTSTKVTDPDNEELNRTVPTNLLSDVVFLLVSPTFNAGSFSLKIRAHDQLFRWLKQIGNPNSEVLRFNFYDDCEDLSVAELCDTMIEKVVNKVKTLVKTHRDKRIVLVGWQTTCFFNHRALQLTHGVSAIINFGFPVLTTEGVRGHADDDILLTYCPSLFVAGSRSEDFDAVAMTEMRSNMMVPTGLVMINEADCNLHVSTQLLSKAKITQRTVFRGLVEQVIRFLDLPSTKMEKSQLIPAELNNIYNVDASKFTNVKDKSKTTTNDVPTREDPRKDQKKAAKRKLSYVVPPPSTAALPAMPSLTIENNVSVSQARNRFDQLIRKGIPSPIDTGRTSQLGHRKESSTFREPKAPYKNSPFPSPSLPVDPASISLN